MKLHISSLQNLMVEDSLYDGFLLTGQTVTVAFWRCKEHIYLFNSHAVNEERRYDFLNENNNLVQLFLYDGYFSLASLLLRNAAMDGVSRKFSMTKVCFLPPHEQALPTISGDIGQSAALVRIPSCVLQPDRPLHTDHKLQCLDLGFVTSSPAVQPYLTDSLQNRKGSGRPKKSTTWPSQDLNNN